ncbi:MAG TPA: IS1595 family transposase [Allosphingosinicella sp.]|nr:IS1595 family transposase [Allosphingosinicella sp.]
MAVLSRPHFHDEAKAFEHLEMIIWNGEPVCPHCGCTSRITKVKANPEKRIRLGLWRCGDCKKQFTVKGGTVFEHMRLPLNKALQAVYLLTSSKKGISAHQLHRVLEITYKSAWFLAHRVREAMRSGTLAPFGSAGGTVEADETYIGREPGTVPGRGGYYHKMKVLALIDRETGRSRAMVIDRVDTATIRPILLENISREARLMSDEAAHYKPIGGMFAARASVNHAVGEYVSRDDSTVHANTIEGYFSIFKRGMKGVYQHCGKKHLHRYLAEFDFRYSNRAANGFNDGERSVEALKGIVGKRLTYQTANQSA